MLLRFGVSNSRSIAHYQELSLVASKLKDEAGPLFDLGSTVQAVPVAVLYGANASGKSNVLYALRFMCNAVRRSHSANSPEGRLPVSSFRLDPNVEKAPSKFDIDFTIRNVRYHYGFELDSRYIHREWLYAFVNRSKQTWFVRDRAKPSIYFGRSLKGQNRTIEELTRENSLFLSAAAQNNHEQLLPIFKYFTDGIIFNSPDSAEDVAEKIESSPEVHKVLSHFLGVADIGILKAKTEQQAVDPRFRSLFQAFLPVIREQLGAEGESLKEFPETEKTVRFAHRSSTGNVEWFDWSDESDGTKSLLRIILPMYEVLQSGGVFVVDELDRSLHTLLAMQIIETFKSSLWNHANAQLICTTHDTNVLCSGLLRRDEIWFVEKDAGGASHLYPLSSLKTRKSDNLEKGYLQGRFGAIPILRPLNGIEEALDEELNEPTTSHSTKA